MNTLISQGKCQYCGNPLKVSIWKRKVRKREAYGILLIVIGVGAIQLIRSAGIIVLLIGLGLIGYGFLKPRVSS